MLGTIKWLVSNRGFGFIERADKPFDVFVHARDFPEFRAARVGQKVEFEVYEDPQQPGRERAYDVFILDDSPAL